MIGIAEGAFGERYMVAETILATIPLALIALSIAPALRAGVFTIGSEGQVAIGAMTATTTIMILPPNSGAMLLVGGAVGGILGGLIWAAIPAVLRAYGRVNEILSTLLLNYIAGYLLLWMLKTWLATRSIVPLPRSDPLPDPALIPKVLKARDYIGDCCWFRCSRWCWAGGSDRPRSVLSRHRDAYRVGAPDGVEHPAGSHDDNARFRGGAGLVGWLQVAGVAGTLYPTAAGGLGFTGVLVALLGRLGPVGILIAALFFGILKTGADGLQAGTGVPSSISTVIEGLVLFVAALSFAAPVRKLAKPASRQATDGAALDAGLQKLGP